MLEVYIVQPQRIKAATQRVVDGIGHAMDRPRFKVETESLIKTVCYGDVGGQPMKITIEPFMI